MRRALALCVAIGTVSTGCTSRLPYMASPTPIPQAAGMPVWRTEEAVTVGVDPYVQPERQQAVFDATLHQQGVLPIQVFIQNRGAERLQLRHQDIVLELPDGTQRQPLLASRVAHLVLEGHDDAVGEANGFPLAFSEPAYLTALSAAFLALGLVLLPGDIDREDTRRKASEARMMDYRGKEFQDVILETGEVAHGFVFFTSPEAHGFRKATLVLRVKTGNAPDSVVRVRLSGLGGTDNP